MNCFRHRHKNHSSCKSTNLETDFPSDPDNSKLKEELLLRIPGCTVHLVQDGETIELSKGEFTLFRLSDDNVFLATVIKVGDDLQWPLTKDEPVVKLDALQYIFSLPIQESDLLSYGVSFSKKFSSELGLLDSFLKEHSCFSSNSSSSSDARGVVDWRNFAPRIEEYNGVLGKAIAGGTGQIVKGIFNCSNTYTKQVQKGGEMITTHATEEKNDISASGSKSNNSTGGTKKSGINKGLKRVRKLSKMTEKMSKSLLNGVGVVTGSVVTPMVRSQAGKTILATVPGEVLLASLDAVNKVMDAVEAAEKQSLTATSRSARRMVSKRFGENAGEATEDVLATAGHCVCTAWNIFKIRKAIDPKAALRPAIVKNAKRK